MLLEGLARDNPTGLIEKEERRVQERIEGGIRSVGKVVSTSSSNVDGVMGLLKGHYYAVTSY